jgi:hypothetical protein
MAKQETRRVLLRAGVIVWAAWPRHPRMTRPAHAAGHALLVDGPATGATTPRPHNMHHSMHGLLPFLSQLASRSSGMPWSAAGHCTRYQSRPAYVSLTHLVVPGPPEVSKSCLPLTRSSHAQDMQLVLVLAPSPNSALCPHRIPLTCCLSTPHNQGSVPASVADGGPVASRSCVTSAAGTERCCVPPGGCQLPPREEALCKACFLSPAWLS